MVMGLAVLGVLVAIGALSLNTPSSQTFANDLRSVLYKARLEAAKRSRPVAVVWNSAEQEFTVRYNTSSSLSSSACNATTISETLSTTEYKGVSISASLSGNGLIWLPNGLVTTCGGTPQAASIAISNGHVSKTVSVSIIGKVVIQ
jgi:Tfp pilus assembly protein FimT